MEPKVIAGVAVAFCLPVAVRVKIIGDHAERSTPARANNKRNPSIIAAGGYRHRRRERERVVESGRDEHSIAGGQGRIRGSAAGQIARVKVHLKC